MDGQLHMQTDGISQLTTAGLIEVQGADAAQFLHAQLSNDILHMNENEVRLAAYCSPQGRVLANFFILKLGEEQFWLICSADTVDSTLKKLQMYVLRSRVTLTNITQQQGLYAQIKTRSAQIPTAKPWTHKKTDDVVDVELPAVANFTRHILITDSPENLPLQPNLSLQTWQWLCVRSGITLVNEATKEKYIPQMLNYESLDAIDFEKGCYPGQEVVARSQFRGTLKRRTYLIHSPEELSVGTILYTRPKKGEDQSLTEVGEVTQAAPNPECGWDALAVLQAQAADKTLALLVKQPSGELIATRILPLPYLIKQDI